MHCRETARLSISRFAVCYNVAIQLLCPDNDSLIITVFEGRHSYSSTVISISHIRDVRVDDEICSKV